MLIFFFCTDNIIEQHFPQKHEIELVEIISSTEVPEDIFLQ